LIVIAIIAVLAALLLPALKNAKESVKKVVCISNLRQLATGFTLYATDFNGTYPPLNFYTTTPKTLSDGSEYPGSTSLQYYQWYTNKLHDNDYVRVSKWKNEKAGEVDLVTDVWVCPSLTPERFRQGGGYGPAENIIRYSYRDEQFGSTRNINQIKSPSNLYLIGDAWQPRNSEQPFCSWKSIFPPSSIGPTGGWALVGGVDGWDVAGIEQSAPRHIGQAVCVAFFDGHSEAMKFQALRNNVNNVFGPEN